MAIKNHFVKIGLIINPLAGIGGRVGLKGSDGLEIQQKALQLGAIPRSQMRVTEALEVLLPDKEKFSFITCPENMGEEVVKKLGFDHIIIDLGNLKQVTMPEHTISAAVAMAEQGVDLLLFAGGDGTARDIFNAIGDHVLALGIPAGVKIQSAVFARSPRSAGVITRKIINGQWFETMPREVIDLDEDQYRAGQVNTKLFGYLNIPQADLLIQSSKIPSGNSEKKNAISIAESLVRSLKMDTIYILGPGSTTREITNALGLPKTLLGVDVIQNGSVLANDVNEKDLMNLLEKFDNRILVVTPIGGQGYIFGRGNQQLSPRVLKQIGKENLIVVATEQKMISLGGKPLLVDSGDREVDLLFSGYTRVTTGMNRFMLYKVVV